MSCHAAQTLDRHGTGNGPLHDLHPRAKLLAVVVFVLAVVSFPKYAVGPLLPFCLFPLGLAAIGRVPARPVLQLLRLGLPLVAMAGIWNVFLDPARVVLPGGWRISAGWFSFSSILLRYALTAGAALMLIATTTFPRLIRAMAGPRSSHPFLQLLHVLYRHLFLLVDEGRALAHAWKLRSPQQPLPDVKTAGYMIGNLLLRTETRAGRVYHAMVLRGYDGSLTFRAEPRWGWRETLFLLGTIAGCLVCRLVPLTDILGQFVLRLWE